MEKRVTVWVCHFADRKALQLQWTDPDTGRTKTRSARTDKEEEAERARSDLEYELNHGKYQEASRLTWERFRELFEAEYLASRRLNTQLGYEDTLDAFEDICQPARLRSISERTVSQFAAGLRERESSRGKGNQPSTIKVRLQHLGTALRWAVQQKMLPACPHFPSVKVPKKRPQPVPPESFERLYAKTSDPQMQALVLCGWLAGLRRCEALALEREPADLAPYVDLARNRIILPAAFAKADEDQWVPLDPVLRKALLALPDYGPRFFRFVAKDGHELNLNTIGQKVAKLAAQAGVKLTLHGLRRGFGCRYAGKVPAQVLQRLMRHSNIKITMDYYANVDQAVEEAILGQANGCKPNSSPNSRPETASEMEATAEANSSLERRTDGTGEGAIR
jgi:integrase